MTTPAEHTIQFAEFAKRFVTHYWEGVANGTTDLPPNEQIEESLDEILAEVNCETSWASGKYILRMMRGAVDTWRFTFERVGDHWVLVKATAGTAPHDNRVDLLNSTYARWFRPFLDRIANSATDSL